MIKQILTTLTLCSLFCNYTFSQKENQVTINWQENVELEDGTSIEYFEDATYNFDDSSLPVYQQYVSLNQGVESFKLEIFNEKYAVNDKRAFSKEKKELISKTLKVETQVLYEKGKEIGLFKISPYVQNQNGELKRLVSFSYRVESKLGSRAKRNSRNFEENSVLASGEWYKFSIQNDGVYKVTGAFLQELGVNLSGLSSNSINLYGNGGELLPFENSIFRHDDLQPNAIEMHDGGDGVFGSGDFFLFYGKGPNSWTYNESEGLFEHQKHYYSSLAYYFVGIDIGDEVRISDAILADSPATHTVETFDDYSFYEVNEKNMVQSGRELYGEEFDIVTEYDFSGGAFTFPNLDGTKEVSICVDAIGRTLDVGSSSFNIQTQSNQQSFSITSVNNSYTAPVARAGKGTLNFLPSDGSSDLSVNLTFNKFAANSKGWLNYIRINARRHLVLSGNQMDFRDTQSIGADNISEYKMQSASSLHRIWDVSDPINPENINFNLNGSEAMFRTNSDELKQFIAFKNSGYLSPTAVGSVANQNLHGMGFPDMVILSNSSFLSQANELADLHREEGLEVQVVTPIQVYNEFSSGNPDITAVKMMMKMLYDRATSQEEEPRYLLLFGDGSYLNNGFEGNTNFLLTYQSNNSLSPLGSYVSDDYFGLLDDNEGEGSDDFIDIGIGRLPVKNVEEANAVVAKIKSYQSQNTQNGLGHCSGLGSDNVFGNWRNQLFFVGDDQDSNIHMSQANQLGQQVQDTYPEYDQTKVFLDAYVQESTPGGARYPEVEKAIRDNIERGNLITTYVGHGGEIGWAAERILDITTIQKFQNRNSLPVFLTATCEFSRYDDYERTSAGELLLLNPDGGAIALLTTTRLVFSSPNYALAQNFFEVALEDEDFDTRLGDIVRLTKNATLSNGTNKRNFSLLGDPALKMSYPKYTAETLSYTDVDGNAIDTLNALSQVIVNGRILDENGVFMPSFNGEIIPVVFDKESTVNTLQNDGNSVFQFKTRRNTIYRGKAEVTNGEFSFTFVVPKDINYQFGSGRVSYYGLSQDADAHGFDENIIIGGSSDGSNDDGSGPSIDLFMNDENFVQGGMTNEEPILIAKVFDESGINTVGNGIGHDLTVVIDENSTNTITVNDFYESDLNTFKSGSVRYQLPALEPGEHTLSFKVWDVYNNSNSKTIDFIVAEDEEFALSHVLNYPNPFTTHTEFFFEHNRNCNSLEVDIQVFTVSGKLVKTISRIVNTEGFRSDGISWDGLDDFGDKIGKGVYVYRVHVKTPTGEKQEKFEKLVILN